MEEMRAKRLWSIWVCAALLVLAGYSISPAPLSAAKRTVKKSPTPNKPGAKKVSVQKTAQSSTGKNASGPTANRAAAARKAPAPPARAKAPASRRSSWRTVQTSPSRDRIIEIQEALAGKGYFSGSPTGDWGAASIDALKRFQQDQSLDPTGRINALSLIALGLGPKRETPLSSALAPGGEGAQEAQPGDVQQ
jgi:hypothetical protein